MPDGDKPAAGTGAVYHLDPVGGDPLVADAFADPYAPDDALVRAAAAGSRQAYSLLVRRYESACFNWARHVTGTAVPAREVTVETFRRAWLRLPSAEANIGSWLHRIAVGVVDDWAIGDTTLPDADAVWLGGVVREALAHLTPNDVGFLYDPFAATDETSRLCLNEALFRLRSLLAARGIGRYPG